MRNQTFKKGEIAILVYCDTFPHIKNVEVTIMSDLIEIVTDSRAGGSMAGKKYKGYVTDLVIEDITICPRPWQLRKKTPPDNNMSAPRNSIVPWSDFIRAIGFDPRKEGNLCLS